MNTIAAKQLRSGMVRWRPPYGGRGGAGSNGSTSAHSSSGTRSSASVVMARILPDQPQRSETTSKDEVARPALDTLGAAGAEFQSEAALGLEHIGVVARVHVPAGPPIAFDSGPAQTWSSASASRRSTPGVSAAGR